MFVGGFKGWRRYCGYTCMGNRPKTHKKVALSADSESHQVLNPGDSEVDNVVKWRNWVIERQDQEVVARGFWTLAKPWA